MTTQPNETQATLRNILLATDFSRCATVALAHAAAIARRYSARIYLTHVIAPEAYQFQTLETGADSVSVLRQCCDRYLSELASAVSHRGVRCEYLLQHGEIKDLLLADIRKHDIDLVVMGTHGRGGSRSSSSVRSPKKFSASPLARC